ncbi:MAG: EAL domain-containing protein [Pseudolabrys sp.]
MRGTVLRGLTRRNLIAIAAGVLLAGAPLVAFDFWLGDFIDKAAQAEISVAARRAVALAEGRIDQVRAALDAAAEAGVRDCNPAAVTAMRQAAFDAAPIKDVLLIGPAGQTLCSGAAMPLGSLQLVSSHPLSGEPGLSLDIMRAPGGTTMIRLRRKVAAGVNELAALMPAGLLLPQASLGDRRTSAYIALVTADGQVIDTAGVRPRRGEPSFTKRANVAPLGMAYDIVVPRALVPATRSNIELIANIAVGGVLLLVALFVLFMRRRAPRNPVAEMERALKAGEFVPYYQPIVDIASGQLRGAEVLVRWRKPDGTLVSPGSFIPLAESSGLIRPMTRHLMKAVCREAGEAIGRRPTLKISFNFAGYLFSDPTIVNEVRNAFAGGPIRFSQVVLEVTERDPIENFTETRRTIAALQELGVRIAIDDVGTGHSGLSYLLKLGVDIIKIDKIFVDAVGRRRCRAVRSCGWSRPSIRRPGRKTLRRGPSRDTPTWPPERPGRGHRSRLKGCFWDKARGYEKRRPIGPPSFNATREEPSGGSANPTRPARVSECVRTIGHGHDDSSSRTLAEMRQQPSREAVFRVFSVIPGAGVRRAAGQGRGQDAARRIGLGPVAGGARSRRPQRSPPMLYYAG